MGGVHVYVELLSVLKWRRIAVVVGTLPVNNTTVG